MVSIQIQPRMTLDEIESRLHEAIRTLAALPDKERAWLYPKLTSWPLIPVDESDGIARALERVAAGKSAWALPSVKRPPPTPSAIDRMLPTLEWLKFTDKRGRKLIQERAFGVPFYKLAGKFGRSEYLVEKWNREALKQIRRGLAMMPEK